MGNRHFKKQTSPAEMPPAPSIEDHLVGKIKRESKAKASSLELVDDDGADKLPSYPPYSVSVYWKNDSGALQAQSREQTSELLEIPAAEAIARAGKAFDNPRVELVEIHDKPGSLVATGNRKDGLRILRRLDFSDPLAGEPNSEESSGDHRHLTGPDLLEIKTKDLAKAIESFFEEAGKVALGWKFDKLDDGQALREILDLLVVFRRESDKARGRE